MILPLMKFGEPVLRQVAAEVEEITPEIARVFEDMLETMHAEGGVGLAAPQVGLSMRLVVTGLDGVEHRLINPEIVESRGRQVSHEACLSIPGAAGEVQRAARIVVHYTDLEGVRRKLTTTGLLARVLQHEIDHLHGVLFIDRLELAEVITAPAEIARIPRVQQVQEPALT